MHDVYISIYVFVTETFKILICKRKKCIHKHSCSALSKNNYVTFQEFNNMNFMYIKSFGKHIVEFK